MQDSKVCQGGDELVITDTVDRVYTKPDAIQKVSDPAFDRTLVVENSGHNSVVIWNPWEAGAKSMGDMNDDGFNNMICVESVSYAETLAQGQSVQPGESYSLTSTISAE
jgi:glucose-6-phosphate 1-epimerase